MHHRPWDVSAGVSVAGTTIPERKEIMHAEVRGRNRTWKVWTPDQGQMAHTIPLYDKEGDLKEMLVVGAPPDAKGVRLVECYGGPFATAEEAIEYARYLGYTDVRVIKTKTQREALALARAAQRKENP